MKQTKVIHLRFKDKSRKQRDYFFGSVKAIYDVLTEEELGLKFYSLQAQLKDGRYENPYIDVTKGILISSKQKNKRNEAE